MASALAILAGNIAGAVGCGAGFTESYPANPQLNFVYAGLVGKGDMNYLEMKSIATQLTIFQIPNRIFIFEDGHQWPP
ncbi:MAG: hypothetical protein KDI06_14965 [Calditrichaeota bacterium]|nr:hypothetical protein [Calditrichota bacterium]HQU71315.1 hypothetical protein [Calditrichia bacterium]